MKDKKLFEVLLNENTFIPILIKSYLKQTKSIQYLQITFKDTLESLCNYSIRLEESKNINNNEVIKPSDLIPFCEKLLNSIIESLMSMPLSIRYLLKLIEVQKREIVSL